MEELKKKLNGKNCSETDWKNCWWNWVYDSWNDTDWEIYVSERNR